MDEHPIVLSSAANAPPLPPQPPPTRGAGFWIRGVAYALDALALTLIQVTAGGISRAFAANVAAVDHAQRVLSRELALSFFIGAVVTFLFASIAQGLSGTSPGKLACRLAVRRLDGSRISIVDAMKRSLLLPLDMFPAFGINAARSMRRSPLRQRVGDRWAQTLVISSHDARLYGRVSPAAIAIAFATAISCAFVFEIAMLASLGAFSG